MITGSETLSYRYSVVYLLISALMRPLSGKIDLFFKYLATAYEQMR